LSRNSSNWSVAAMRMTAEIQTAATVARKAVAISWKPDKRMSQFVGLSSHSQPCAYAGRA